ncbi:MAG: flippase-like domain-containing protein [Chitinispirillaceae bacterium]|nr:flippase-like domain-containing protein [Chitinispirillaceae bacterium]
MKYLLTVGKLLLAALPIIWIFHYINIEKLGHSLQTTAWWTLPVMMLCILSLMFLQGIKWWMLLHAFLPDLSIAEVLSCHFKGIYYSIFLPTSAAQDVVRTVLLARNSDYGIVWGATWLARISGLVVLLGLSLYGIITVQPAMRPPGTTLLFIVSGGGILLLSAVTFSKLLTRRIRIIVSKILPRKVVATVEHIREGVYHYRNRRGCLLQVLLVTIVSQGIVVMNAVFLMKGITGKWYIAECFAYIPLIEIICLSVPLTPNGIGVRDALTALMFHAIGLPAEQLGTYILLGFASIVMKVVGGVPVLFYWITSLTGRNRNDDRHSSIDISS